MNKTAKALAAFLILSASIMRPMQNKFNVQNVKLVLGKLLVNRVEVPFEVVGFRALFAQKLNSNCAQDHAMQDDVGLTHEEIKLLLTQTRAACALTQEVILKLKVAIDKTYKHACKRIKNSGLEDEVAWRKQHYKYTPNFGLVDNNGKLPEYVRDVIPDYIEKLNLEEPFSIKDLRANYNEEY